MQEILVSLQDELSILKTKFASEKNNNNYNNNKKNNKRNKKRNKKSRDLSLASERESVNNNITLSVNAERNINENNDRYGVHQFSIV